MKIKRIAAIAFVMMFLAMVMSISVASAYAREQGIPEDVVAILAEVNGVLKVREIRKNLGFIERTPNQETYPTGFIHIVGRTKNGTTFVIDSFIFWVSPQENKYLVPPLVAGKTVPAVWWWKEGKKFEWKATPAEAAEDAPESRPPAKTPTNGTTI